MNLVIFDLGTTGISVHYFDTIVKIVKKQVLQGAISAQTINKRTDGCMDGRIENKKSIGYAFFVSPCVSLFN